MRTLDSTTEPVTVPVTLRAAADAGETLDDETRADMLRRLAAGEHVEVVADIVAYSQRDGRPNRNFVRFAPERLAEIAKTALGRPFLKDHAQYTVDAEGGEILASTAETIADGSVEIRQTVRLTEPWSVRRALTGRLAAFSIGWRNIPPPGRAEARLHCSNCRDDVRLCVFELDHRRGRVVDGRPIEWEFQNADLVETSNVVVPAVVEARPLDVRPALAAEDIVSELSTYGIVVSTPANHPQEKTVKLETLLAALGLDGDADEAAALRGLRALKAKADEADTKLAEVSAKLDAAEARATAAEAAVEALRREAAETAARTWADDLVSEGRLAPDGALYTHLVEIRGNDPEKAQALADALPRANAVGAEMKSSTLPEPTLGPATSGDEPDYDKLAARLPPEERRSIPKNCTPADYVRHNYAELADAYGWEGN